MRFYDRLTCYHFLKRLGATPNHYRDIPAPSVAAVQVDREAYWLEAHSPFYNIWPKITPLLLGLDLAKVKGTDIDEALRPVLHPKQPTPLLLRFSHQETALYFPDELHPETKYKMRTLLLVLGENPKLGPSLEVWMDYEEVPGMPYNDFIRFPLTSETIDQALFSLPIMPHVEGVMIGQDIRRRIARLVCCLALISRDDIDLFTPVVLQADSDRFDATRLMKFVRHAHQRGVFGTHVGRELETSPHYRNAHPALFWTGKGRTTPVVKLRRGSVIHRDLVQRIPTGHLPTDPPGAA